MDHLYLFTLEITPLQIDAVYDDLPPHLTLMSRFRSHLSPNELAERVRPLFTSTGQIQLVFGETTQLGPKKVTVHLLESLAEEQLHQKLQAKLNELAVAYEYPQFIGEGHKPHVTKREGIYFQPGAIHIAHAAYLIEVMNKKRVVRTRFDLKDQ